MIGVVQKLWSIIVYAGDIGLFKIFGVCDNQIWSKHLLSQAAIRAPTNISKACGGGSLLPNPPVALWLPIVFYCFLMVFVCVSDVVNSLSYGFLVVCKFRTFSLCSLAFYLATRHKNDCERPEKQRWANDRRQTRCRIDGSLRSSLTAQHSQHGILLYPRLFLLQYIEFLIIRGKLLS